MSRGPAKRLDRVPECLPGSLGSQFFHGSCCHGLFVLLIDDSYAGYQIVALLPELARRH
jgi:hypothetical protein